MAPPRFSYSPSYPPKKNFAKSPRYPLDFQLLCIDVGKLCKFEQTVQFNK
jgi:hypothetical protein